MIAHKSLTLGAGLLVLGLFVLFVEVSGENLILVFMPFLMIGCGLLLLISPTLVPSNASHAVQFIGEYRQHYCHAIDDKSIFMGIGDVELDFSHIALPSGDTNLKIICLAGGIHLKFRSDFAYHIRSRAFVSEVTENGQEQDFVVSTFKKSSRDFEISGQRLNIEILSFVSDINIQ